MNTDYPTPKSHRPKLAVVPKAYQGEFGNTIEEREDRIFRAALYFNVVRYGSHNGSESATTDHFPTAMKLAHEKPRSLIYVVANDGSAFCMSHKRYPHFAELWLARKGGNS